MPICLKMESNEKLSIGLPAGDELEVTTIGPGKANGESIIIHLGNGEWMIVDSCMSGDKVLPLYYLDKIGVDYSRVTHVICTHWHTDHVRGLPKVLENCENAILLIAPVSDQKGNLDRILKLAGLKTINSSVWNIFDACLKALSSNGRPGPDYISKNAPVIMPKEGPVEVSAIGPSNDMMDRFYVSLANLNPDNPQVSQVEDLEGNLCSLALALKFVSQRVLLGGDVETGRKKESNYSLCSGACATHDKLGWCDALDAIAYKAFRPFNFVKLPHHSSENGYCPKMWQNDMVTPLAVTTAFQNSESENHPRKVMLQEYAKYCSRLYTTCACDEIKETDAPLHDFRDDDDIQVVDAIEEGIGIVVCRWTSISGWREYCFGEGSLVDGQYLAHYHY